MSDAIGSHCRADAASVRVLGRTDRLRPDSPRHDRGRQRVHSRSADRVHRATSLIASAWAIDESPMTASNSVLDFDTSTPFLAPDLDHVQIGRRPRASQNDGDFRAVWEQFSGRFAGIVGVGAMANAGWRQQAGFRGVQGCNPSSPSPQTPRPRYTGAPQREIEFAISCI